MRQTVRYHALATLLSFGVTVSACTFTDNGDDNESIGSLSSTADPTEGDGSDSDSGDGNDDPSAGSVTTTAPDPTSDPTADSTSDPTDDPNPPDTEADPDASTSDDGTPTTGEDPTDGGSCTPGADDSACEVCVATSCCQVFLDCSQGGTSFACDCHTSCLDEGYPESCSGFCGPAPDEFGPLLACAQADCSVECGL